MKAMVLAMAARVGDSAFGRSWSKAGDVLDKVIPVALLILIVVVAGAIMFGFLR